MLSDVTGLSDVETTASLMLSEFKSSIGAATVSGTSYSCVCSESLLLVTTVSSILPSGLIMSGVTCS